MSNQLFATFVKWMLTTELLSYEESQEIINAARFALNDQDTIEQRALNYLVDQYNSITQS